MTSMFRFLLLSLVAAGFSSAQKIQPPSDFKVTVLGVNSFLLEWKDNSDNEDGFQIYASIDQPDPPPFDVIEGADQNQFLLIAYNIPNQTVRFRLSAYKGVPEDRKFSEKTSIVTVKTPPKPIFEAARNLKASTIDDSTIRLKWEDVSTSEAGYLIELRRGDGEWITLGNTPVQKRYNLTVSSLIPSSDYSFRVTAYRGDATLLAPRSNEATATTLPFQAPTGLRVKSEGEGSVSLRWKDNSSLEEGYEVQVKSGDKKFRSIGFVAANTKKTAPIALEYDTRHQIRVRGFRTVDGKIVFTDFSQVVSKRSLGLARPSDLKIAGISGGVVSLTWKDRSEREEGYLLRYQIKGKQKAKLVKLPAGSESYQVSGLKAGNEYEFQVRVFDGKSVSRYSPSVARVMPNQYSGKTSFALTQGVSFFEELKLTGNTGLAEISVSGLPPGISFNEDQFALLGVPTQPGEYVATLDARYEGDQLRQKLTFRVLAQEGIPEVVDSFDDVSLASNGSSQVSLVGRFRDPDVSDARRFVTNLGTFDVVLYSEATPLTVANFLKYADGGRYKDTFFHRAPTGFVVQGGGFTTNGSSFGKVSTFAAVKNEPGISNLTGTVAMAKLGGDPDSATSQFFINLSDDNASNLDFQNGGFTVFGRIAGNGMAVFDEIDALPKGTYSINYGDGPVSFGDVPVQGAFPAPVDLDPKLLVRVTSVSKSPILAYSASSSNPAVATVSIVGSEVVIQGKASGAAVITVQATDLDGSSVDQVFSVTVN